MAARRLIAVAKLTGKRETIASQPTPCFLRESARGNDCAAKGTDTQWLVPYIATQYTLHSFALRQSAMVLRIDLSAAAPALRPTRKRGQNANICNIYSAANWAAEGIRSYISTNDSQWRALRCRGRSRICLQDRNDDGHAPKPSRDIVASCRFYRGSPPRVAVLD